MKRHHKEGCDKIESWDKSIHKESSHKYLVLYEVPGGSDGGQCEVVGGGGVVVGGHYVVQLPAHPHCGLCACVQELCVEGGCVGGVKRWCVEKV